MITKNPTLKLIGIDVRQEDKQIGKPTGWRETEQHWVYDRLMNALCNGRG